MHFAFAVYATRLPRGQSSSCVRADVTACERWEEQPTLTQFTHTCKLGDMSRSSHLVGKHLGQRADAFFLWPLPCDHDWPEALPD